MGEVKQVAGTGTPAEAVVAGGGSSGTRFPALAARTAGGIKVIGLQLVRYLTNNVVTYLPSRSLRRTWYRLALGMQIAQGTEIQRDTYVYVGARGQSGSRGISIGRRCVIGRQCCLDGRGGLVIGDDVTVSPGVWILTDGHDMNDPDFREVLARVEIGDGVWLGSRATILPGIIIGAGAAVAEGAVVTADVAPYAMVGGVPARPIGTRAAAAASVPHSSSLA